LVDLTDPEARGQAEAAFNEDIHAASQRHVVAAKLATI
jgi:hypothetical protein